MPRSEQDPTLPIVYVVNPAVAMTGALIASCHAARLLRDDARMVLVLPKETLVRPEEVTDFWRVEYVSMLGLARHPWSMLRYLPLLLRDAWQLKQRMRRDGATRLQLNDFYLMHGSVLRLLGFRGRIVSWVRCNPALLAGALARPMLRLAHCSADVLVAVSAYIQSLLPPPLRSVLLYDCYMGQARAPRVWRDMEEKPLVYVGNYIRGKGQDVALAAFAIAAVEDAALRLHFYGSDMGLAKNQAYRAELEALAMQLHLKDRVRFHDFLPDTYPLLASAYAALNFSVSESFSMTVLEASGAGVPVIATSCGGPQEILREGVTGFLIPVGDVAAAAARILRIARNPVQAEAMGQAGAAHVQATFAPPQFRAALKVILDIP